MQAIRRFALLIDDILENFSLLALLSMVIIVVVQVFTRKLLNFVFFWSEEVTLLLLGWFTYMGIAIGFREHLHLEMDMIANLIPKKANWLLDKIIEFSAFLFGAYLVYYGYDFCVLTWDSTMPATKLPNTAIYAVMPVTGMMICTYMVLQLIGVDTRRHTEDDPEGGLD